MVSLWPVFSICNNWSVASYSIFRYNMLMETNMQSAQPPAVETPNSNEISWTASEFIEHKKTSGWYFVLFLATIGLAAAAFFVADLVASIMIIVAAVLFGIIASRKPRELTYIINSSGITVGNKKFPYASFKSFSLIQEGGIQSIWLLPAKRFDPGLSIYFAPTEGQNIVNLLGTFIPYEDRKLDPVDKLMHRLRF